MDPARTVGERLRQLRTERGLTQRQLADERYSVAFVSSVESGRRRPSVDALQHFAARLGVPADELRDGRPPVAELQTRLAEARHAVSGVDLAAARTGYEQVRHDAESAGHVRLEAEALRGLARCAERDGDVAAALDLTGRALIRLEHEPLATQVPAIVNKARLFRYTGQLTEATELMEQTLQALRDQGLAEPAAIVALNYNLVGVYIDRGLFDEAAKAAERALRLAPTLADPETVAGMWVQVGRTYLTQGRFADAEAAQDNALAIYEQLDYALEVAMSHWARGYLFSREGRYPDAERELTQARRMLHDLDSWHYAGAMASELATVLWRQGRVDQAVEALEDAWRMEREAPGSILPLADAHRLRADLALEAGDSSTAERSLRTALDGYLTADAGPDAADTARVLGDLLREDGRDTEAMEMYRRGLPTRPNTAG